MSMTPPPCHLKPPFGAQGDTPGPRVTAGLPAGRVTLPPSRRYSLRIRDTRPSAGAASAPPLSIIPPKCHPLSGEGGSPLSRVITGTAAPHTTYDTLFSLSLYEKNNNGKKRGEKIGNKEKVFFREGDMVAWHGRECPSKKGGRAHACS